MEVTTYRMPYLPFETNALEPFLTIHTVSWHLSTHRLHLNKLNEALQRALRTEVEVFAADYVSEEAMYEARRVVTDVQFHAGAHVNHTLFWSNLAPTTDVGTRDLQNHRQLLEAINHHWGSELNFKAEFKRVFTNIQGSGLAWLAQVTDPRKHDYGDLVIVRSRNENILPHGLKPLLAIDAWEHAYFCQVHGYAEVYLAKFWMVIKWGVVQERYLKTVDEVFGDLRGLVNTRVY